MAQTHTSLKSLEIHRNMGGKKENYQHRPQDNKKPQQTGGQFQTSRGDFYQRDDHQRSYQRSENPWRDSRFLRPEWQYFPGYSSYQ